MTDLIWGILLLAGGGLLVAALLSPFETLGWWAGWFGPAVAATAETHPAVEPSAGPSPRAMVLLLWGINDVGAVTSGREAAFADRLTAALGPDIALVRDIFPYSAFGMPLSGDRLFGRLWDRIVRTDADEMLKEGLLNLLVNIRNALQVAVSADRRYGPLHNYGAALQMMAALRRAGHRPGTPILIIGYSGGAQVGLGAAGHVATEARAPVRVVSLGGVINSEAALATIDSLLHVAGSRDLLQQVGLMVFPERWPVMRHSHWNRAKAAGRIRFARPAGVGHSGDRGYFGTSPVADGRAPIDQTVALITGEALALTHSDWRTQLGTMPAAR